VSTWTATVDGPVAELVFRRPPRNLLSHADVEGLERALDDAAARGARVAVLAGGLDGFFIAHADLEDLDAMAAGRATSGDPAAWIRVLRALDRGPLLSIAAINGQAWGGGLEVALTCNLRLMSHDASLCFPEVALGILPGVAAHRAIRLLPDHVALELLAAAAPVGATRAAELGLVNRVCAPAALRDEARALAARIAAFPAPAVAAVRELVVGHRDATERELRRRQSALWDELATGPESHALIGAALERYAGGADSAGALGI
jgi:enoyl-CoA hydratase/carnithine racemase